MSKFKTKDCTLIIACISIFHTKFANKLHFKVLKFSKHVILP